MSYKLKIKIYFCRGSSVVEQMTENHCVVSPILTLGTLNNA